MNNQTNSDLSRAMMSQDNFVAYIKADPRMAWMELQRFLGRFNLNMTSFGESYLEFVRSDAALSYQGFVALWNFAVRTHEDRQKHETMKSEVVTEATVQGSTGIPHYEKQQNGEFSIRKNVTLAQSQTQMQMQMQATKLDISGKDLEQSTTPQGSTSTDFGNNSIPISSPKSLFHGNS